MLFNKQRADELLERYGVDAIVGVTPESVGYFTNLECWLYENFREYMLSPGSSGRRLPCFAVYRKGGELSTILREPTRYFLKHISGEIVTYGEKAAEKVLCDKLRDLGLERSVIGIESDVGNEYWSKIVKRNLRNSRVGDCSNLLKLIRMIKTDDEIIRLRESAELNELAGKTSLHLEPGRSSIAKQFHDYMSIVGKNGALPEHYIYYLNGGDMSSDPNLRLKKGDVLAIDFGCRLNRYFSDTGFSTSIGSPSRRIQEAYARLVDVSERVIDKIIPGAKCSAILELSKKALASNRLEKTDAHGHGIGLQARDFPIIMKPATGKITDDFVSVSTDMIIQENMVLNFEFPCTYDDNVSFQLERTIVTTKNKCKSIVRQERDSIYS